MKLHGSYTSPYVRHCRIALAQTDQDFELVETDYAASARQSPAARVPFTTDGDRMLTDSASILRLIRERAGQRFFPDLEDYDLFLLANTGLDTAINLFLLERDGLGPTQSPYLARQQQRVDDVLKALDANEWVQRQDAAEPYSDGLLRVGCFVSWGLFRVRLSIDSHPNLRRLLARLDDDEYFSDTHPSKSP